MKYLPAIILSVFCCAASYTEVRAQEKYSFNFDIENGLPSNHVYGVITDKHGYLWIATENGVAKYNGYAFKIFNQSDGLATDFDNALILRGLLTPCGYLISRDALL